MKPVIMANARAQAEALAVQILSFLAGDMERLGPFLSLTGLEPGNLRAAAADPGFLAGVIEYLANNENLLIQFADEAGVDPATVGRAQAILSGPPPEWEA